MNYDRQSPVDFLTKPIDARVLLAAIEKAVCRDQQARQQHARVMEARQRIATLTPCERRVLALVVTGLLNKQIAAELGISEKTVKVHRGRVMHKMGVTSVAELVRLTERGTGS